jgi:hypothetical protein
MGGLSPSAFRGKELLQRCVYGIKGQGWFLGFHCMTKYLKVAW